MPRLASILFATIVITLGGEQLQSAEFDVVQWNRQQIRFWPDLRRAFPKNRAAGYCGTARRTRLL